MFNITRILDADYESETEAIPLLLIISFIIFMMGQLVRWLLIGVYIISIFFVENLMRPFAKLSLVEIDHSMSNNAHYTKDNCAPNAIRPVVSSVKFPDDKLERAFAFLQLYNANALTLTLRANVVTIEGNILTGVPVPHMVRNNTIEVDGIKYHVNCSVKHTDDEGNTCFVMGFSPSIPADFVHRMIDTFD